MELTQEYVKALFDYKDGELYWKTQLIKKAVIGNGASVPHYFKRGNYIRFEVRIDGKSYFRSRIIFLWHNGYLPVQVDHEDRNTQNDRMENLRAATGSQNQCNKKSAQGASSKYLGVHLHMGRCWVAQIRTKKTGAKYVGSYNSEEGAALAYNRAAVIHHGEFANLNIIKL